METPEGATLLDPDEEEDLIPGHIRTKDELSEWEEPNILAAERWLFSRRRHDVLTDTFVRELHRRMFNKTWKWAGKYRRTDKNLGVPWPEVPTSVRQVLDNTSYFIENKTFSLDEIAARLHHSMVVVHPFPNGNGRHTRLLADSLLYVNQGPRFTWGSGDLQRAKSPVRMRYLQALKQADKGNFEDLLAFVRS